MPFSFFQERRFPRPTSPRATAARIATLMDTTMDAWENEDATEPFKNE